MLSNYVKKHLTCNSKEESAVLTNYLVEIMLRPGTTERALFLQFDCGLHAKKPLARDDLLGGMLEVKFPISIVFGETDWMDTRGSAKIIENSKFFRDGWSNLYLLKDAGH